MSSRCLYVKFAWREPVVAALERSFRASAAQALQLFRALESDDACAYTADTASGRRNVVDAIPDASASTLELLCEIRGASAGEPAPFHYVVETDVLAAQESDFNAWYDQEHLPGLAAVPGTVRALRYRNLDDGPRYLACYDLTRPGTLGSPPWLAVRGTPWSERVRPAFRNTRRTMFRRVA
jgi:hypothetical protein